jgi:hypothetical protein
MQNVYGKAETNPADVPFGAPFALHAALDEKRGCRAFASPLSLESVMQKRPAGLLTHRILRSPSSQTQRFSDLWALSAITVAGPSFKRKNFAAVFPKSK